LRKLSDGKAGVLSHKSLHNSGKSFFNMIVTSALERRLLAPL